MSIGINSVFGSVFNRQSYAYRKQNQESALNGSRDSGGIHFGYNPLMDYTNRQEEYDAASTEAERVTTDENGNPCMPYFKISSAAMAKVPLLGIWGTAHPGGDGYYYDDHGNRMTGLYGASAGRSIDSAVASPRAAASAAPDTATRQWLDQSYPSGSESGLVDRILDRVREIEAGSYEKTRSEYEKLLDEGAISESDYHRGLATLSRKQDNKLESYSRTLNDLDMGNSADRAILDAVSRILETTASIEGLEGHEQLARAFTVCNQYKASMEGGASDEYAAFVAMSVNTEFSAVEKSASEYGNANPVADMILNFRQYLLEDYPEVDLGFGDMVNTVAARNRHNNLNEINPWSMHRSERGTGLLFLDQNGDGVANPGAGEIISGRSAEARDRDGDGIPDDNSVDRESLDVNGDGRISGREWDGVKLWFDANGDGQSTADEVVDYAETLRNAGTHWGGEDNRAVKRYDMNAESGWPYHAVGSNGGLGVEMRYLDPDNTNYYVDADGGKQTFGASPFVKLMHSLCASMQSYE